MSIHHALTAVPQCPVMVAAGVKIHLLEKFIHHIIVSKSSAVKRGTTVAAVQCGVEFSGILCKIDCGGNVRILHNGLLLYDEVYFSISR